MEHLIIYIKSYLITEEIKNLLPITNLEKQLSPYFLTEFKTLTHYKLNFSNY